MQYQPATLDCPPTRATCGYFSFRPDCILVKGARRGALYDLASGDVFSIDPAATRVVDACERGRPLEQVRSVVPEVPAGEITRFLGDAERAGLGTFGPQPSTTPKIDLSYRHDTLDFLWLELREDCNLCCRHCYCMSVACSGSKDLLTHEEWERALGEGAELGCRAMQFIGGEPLLYGDRLFDLSAKASALGYRSIGLFSNLTFLKEEWIDRIVEHRMSVSCSLYAKRPEIHDLITGHPGSWQRTLDSARRLQARGIQPRFCVTVMRQNQDYIEETMGFLRELGQLEAGYDLVRPSGRGNDADLVPDERVRSFAYRRNAEFMRTDRETFLRRYNGNGCWQGKLAIASTGEIHPCIMQREHPAGNVREASLRQIIEGPIRTYWGLSLDKIDVCRDCEYRYACHDCRPVSCGPTGQLTAGPQYCCYDPYRGEFAEAGTTSVQSVAGGVSRVQCGAA